MLRQGQFTWSSGEVGTLFEALCELSHVDTVYRGEKGLAPWLSHLQVNAKGFGRTTDLAVAYSNNFELGQLANDAAKAMTVPDLKTLREQCGPVLGAWGYALELTRELTPVFLSERAVSPANSAAILTRSLT